LTKLKEVLVIIPFGLIAKMETQVKEWLMKRLNKIRVIISGINFGNFNLENRVKNDWIIKFIWEEGHLNSNGVWSITIHYSLWS
jgi:hypothetical protein